MDDDAFWNIQLNTYEKNDSSYSWLAPVEREFNTSEDKFTHDDEKYEHCYKSMTIALPLPRFFHHNLQKSFTTPNNTVQESTTITFESNNKYEYHHSINTNPLQPLHLQIRFIQSGKVSLIDSSVGEEVWDAARLFCAYVAHSSNMMFTHESSDFNLHEMKTCMTQNYEQNDSTSTKSICVEGKRILELGSGCGMLALTLVAYGASEVLCTDYIQSVLKNLEFNIHDNLPRFLDYDEKLIKLYKENGNSSKIEQNDHTTNNNEQNHTTDGNTFNNLNHKRSKSFRISYADLDWKRLANLDIRNADWTDAREVSYYDNEDTKQNSTTPISCAPKQFHSGIGTDIHNNTANYQYNCDPIYYTPDIIVGSALVYSVEGAIFCADTIHHYIHNCGTKEAWVLQIVTRPGFDRFLLRLEHWELKYELIDIPDTVYEFCIHYIGEIHSSNPLDEFKLYVIRRKA